ncbi:hypothetical protein QOT17_006859 [Balamuthia mandrillaris]
MTTEIMDVVEEILDHKWEQIIGDDDKLDSKVVLYQVKWKGANHPMWKQEKELPQRLIINRAIFMQQQQ